MKRDYPLSGETVEHRSDLALPGRSPGPRRGGLRFVAEREDEPSDHGVVLVDPLLSLVRQLVVLTLR